MIEKYYLNTSIWMDVYEDRKGYNNEPLGEYGLKLLALIKAKGYKLVITDLIISELEVRYIVAEINGMIKPFEKIIEKIICSKKQKFLFPENNSMFFFVPVTKLSNAITLCPCSKSLSAKWLPIKPAAPATTIVFIKIICWLKLFLLAPKRRLHKS